MTCQWTELEGCYEDCGLVIDSQGLWDYTLGDRSFTYAVDSGSEYYTASEFVPLDGNNLLVLRSTEDLAETHFETYSYEVRFGIEYEACYLSCAEKTVGEGFYEYTLQFTYSGESTTVFNFYALYDGFINYTGVKINDNPMRTFVVEGPS